MQSMDYIYIIEGQQTCWKCKQSTKVIGLGLNEAVHIYLDEFDKPCIDDTLSNLSDELHLAWVDSEEDIPPKLLQYLKKIILLRLGIQRRSAKSVLPITVIVVVQCKEIGFYLMNLIALCPLI